MLHSINKLQCITINLYLKLNIIYKLHLLRNGLIILFAVSSVDIVSAQELVSQSPKLIKSVLTQAGSSNVTYDYLNSLGMVKTTNVRQSIGQNGIVGLSKTSVSSVQQGFLNHIETIKINNPTDEFVEVRSLSVFPNPFKDHVNIKFSQSTVHPIFIDVFDVRGRLVLNKKFQPSELITVSMDRLEDSSYLIRISSGSQKFLKKLIKGIN